MEQQHQQPQDGENAGMSTQVIPPNSSTREYTTRARKALVQRVNELGTTAHEEIFRKLKSHGVDHTQNNNGMFVNLSVVSAPVLDDISAFVDYCIDNDRSLNEYDKKLNECKMNQRFDELPKILGNNRSEDGRETRAHTASQLHNMQSDQSRGKKQQQLLQNETETARAAGMQVVDLEDRDEMNNKSPCLLRLQAIIPLDVEKGGKRKLCTKFNNAKKRFMRKSTADKRGGASCGTDADLMNELHYEPYLIA